MDLVQPGLMSRIVDDGVLGLNQGGLGEGALWQGKRRALQKSELFSETIGENIAWGRHKDHRGPEDRVRAPRGRG